MSAESKNAIASRLAQFLRRNGDKVISGSCKLSLTTSALCLLNTLFAETISNEEISGISIICSSCDLDTSADVKFLYDFMKRTSSLKLFHGVQTLRGGIDLSHFSNLTALELRKIPAHLIVGLDSLALQLKALIVSRSIYLLKEIFGPCGDEHNFSYTWMELKELNLSYNYLETLDESLHSLPNVEIIDLSHNHLSNVTEIQALKRLSFVNLSYNELSRMPVFDIASCRTLTKLYCRNNNLEDLEGLDCLFNLQELDVGYNLLSEYHVLNPLDKLKSLKVLNLEGNPLFFHRRHVTLVASYINENVLRNGLLLNGANFTIPQNKTSEMTDFRERRISNQHQTSINTVVGDTDSIVSAPYTVDRFGRSVSERSSCEDNYVSSMNSMSGSDDLKVEVEKEKKARRRNSKAAKKKRKARDVLISEANDGDVKENVDKVDSVGSPLPGHMKTKELMEARRNELGQAWLIPDSAFQRVMLPVPQVPSNTPISPASSFPTSQTISNLVSKVNSSFANQSAHSPESRQQLPAILTETGVVKTENTEVVEDSNVVKEQALKENDDIEVLSSSCEPDCCSGDLHGTLSKEDLSDCDIYGNNELSYIANDLRDQNEELDSEEESEDSIFFVERQDQNSRLPLSVNIGPNYIKEKDALSAKVLERLDLQSLQSVTTSNKEKDGSCWCEVLLEFNTVKVSKKKRLYIFEDFESAMVMAKKLQPFADANTLEEVTFGALECMKCKSQFSKQVAARIVLREKKADDVYSSSYDSKKETLREVDACPNCKNHILVRMDTFPMPGASPPATVFPMKSSKKFSNSSPHNISPTSDGVLASLFTSIRISPILKRKSSAVVPSDLTQSLGMPTVSEMNTTHSSDGDDSGNMRRISSDMTIMSNTSQSSIAVIPDPEVNLHTILERHSLSSLSPPISQDSTYYKVNNTSESEGHSEYAVSASKDEQKKADLSNLNENEPDFYSLTESSTNASAKNAKTNEVLSSGSENYLSPSRSSASEKPNENPVSESKEVDEVSHLLNILGEKRTITHEAFSEVDHRLKLHLEINVFKDDEELEACLQTSIVPLSTGDEFLGLFAISSKKIYVIKFLPAYGLNLQLNESIEKAIQIVHSTTLNQLYQIKVILGSQGLTMTFGPNSRVFTLVIRDADICNSFTSLLSDFVQEHSSVCREVEFLSSANETLPAMKESVFSSSAESDEMPEILLHLFAFWWDSRNLENDASHPVCVIVTSEDIFISRILYKKQESVPDLATFCAYHYTSVSHQKLSDLVSLKLKKDLRSVEINFLDESSFRESHDSVFWTVRMETKSALFSLISALKNPWEEIFGVPLSLTCEED